MTERNPADKQFPLAKKSDALQPDLVFEREEPPIPTKLLAVNPSSGQAILAQRVEDTGEDTFSIVSLDNSWIPQPLKDREDALKAMRMTEMTPIETEDGQTVIYSSQAEAIEEFRQVFLKENPLPRDVNIEDIIDMAPEDVQEMYWEWKRQKSLDT
jgi:hypothetical protein